MAWVTLIIHNNVNNNIHVYMNNQLLPPGMLETYRVTDLEQVRLLADPLKLRIIQCFAAAPKTTRDVADQLGENLTRLYRHVDALLDAGLIEITSERQKRGTVERTFQAIAQRFEVDHSLFAVDGGNQAVRDIFRAGEEEMMAALDEADAALEPLCMRLQIKASPEQLRELRGRLEEWLDSVQACEDRTSDDATATAGALIAFYAMPEKRS
jgi:DNA-binding transcriptional ArsR family regulator